MEATAKLAQTLAVVIGVVISVLSYSAARRAEALASQRDSAKTFLELRQKYYLETVQTIATLANGDEQSPEYKAAAKKFRDMYVGEMCLVEAADVEDLMVDFAKAKSDLRDLDDLNEGEPREVAIRLAHALRDSLLKSWGLPEAIVDNSPSAPSAPTTASITAPAARTDDCP